MRDITRVSRKSGQILAIRQWLKLEPKGLVICKDLKALDKLVACGIQPSRIAMMAELRPAGYLTKCHISTDRPMHFADLIVLDDAPKVKGTTWNEGEKA